MPTVKDVLEAKSSAQVHTIEEGASVLDAIRKMVQHRIGSLVVIRKDSTVCGIIAERDVIQRLAVVQDDLAKVQVCDVMVRKVIVCKPADSLETVRSIMKNQWIRQMPVVDKAGKLVGIISIGDANAYRISQDSHEIMFLHDYVEGNVR